MSKLVMYHQKINQRMELLKIENKQDELIIDSRHLAHLFEIQHKNVLELINKFENEFNTLGLIAFETERVNTKVGVRETKFYWLSEAQCNLLITFFKNTEIAVKAKLHLIQSFEKAKKLLKKYCKQKTSIAWQEARKLAKDNYAPMSEALRLKREEAGKETKPFHYSNEANLICKVLTGLTPKKYRELYAVGQVREALSSEELVWLNKLQSINIGLIHADWDYDKRKEYLFNFYIKQKDKLRIVRGGEQLALMSGVN